MIQLIFLEDSITGDYYVYLNGFFLHHVDSVNVAFIRFLLERVVKSPISVEEYVILENRVTDVLEGEKFPLEFSNINPMNIERL